MILKISERDNIKRISDFEDRFPVKLNEDLDYTDHNEDKNKLYDLASTVAEMLSQGEKVYGPEDVIQVLDITKTWDYSISEAIEDLFGEGLVSEWEHVNLGIIEWMTYYKFWSDYCWDSGISEKYGEGTGYYSDEYGVFEEGQWVEYNTDIDNDGRLEFNVIIDPVDNEKERVYDPEDLKTAVAKRIAWEEGHYKGDWDPEDENG